MRCGKLLGSAIRPLPHGRVRPPCPNPRRPRPARRRQGRRAGRKTPAASRSCSTSSRPAPDSRDQLIETLADAEDKRADRARVADDARRRDPDGRHDRRRRHGRRAAHGPARHRRAATTRCCTSSSTPAHSRFPVFEERRDNIIGILMAKDLLKLQRSPEPEPAHAAAAGVLRARVKGLNELLRDFRTNRNHLAIVIDEFGHTAGLMTHRGRARGDRRRDRGRVRRRRTASRASTRSPTAASASPATPPIDARQRGVRRRSPADRRVRHHRRPGRRTSSAACRGAASRSRSAACVFAVMLARGGAVRWFKVTRAAEEALGSDGA